MKRNYAVDVLKVVFALFVALGHARIELISSNMIVNCFFALSGFFLVSSYDSGKYNGDNFLYVKGRIIKLYPYYIISLICYLAVLFTKEGFNFPGLFERLGKILPEMFLLQNTGFLVRGGVNYPCWQLSALIISSYILFGLISWNRKFVTDVISPLFVLCGFAYWENLFNSHEVHIWGVEHGFFYVPLVRAFACICLGMWLHDIILKLVVWLKDRDIHPIWQTMLFTVSVLYYFVNNGHTQAFFGFFGILICCLVSQGGTTAVFNRKIYRSCEKLSLAIYFNHAIVLEIIGRDAIRYSSNVPLAIMIFWISLVLLSLVYLVMVDWGMEKMKKVFNKMA